MKLKKRIEELYGLDEEIVEYQLNRYNKIIKIYNENFLIEEFNLFSTPGRTEIGGNHTDHNLGYVLAGSINLDSIAIVSKSENNIVTLISEGYSARFIVDLNNLEYLESEKESTNALIRGIAFRFKQLGYKVGGFYGVIKSDVLQGSGLSSSASIEVLIGTIFNHLFNSGNIDPIEIAKISQFAENEYFRKPCGLMDQMACAVGGIISIDFKNPKIPLIKKMEIDFKSYGYNFVIVNTGGNHVDLTDDYADIPLEMKSVAAEFEESVLRNVNRENIFSNIKKLRSAVGDRAILRAIHYYDENERVQKLIESLKKNEIEDFIDLFNASGNSSFKWLQNIYSTKNIQNQPITLALLLTEEFFKNKNIIGGVRIHGGGFAGTILTLISTDHIDEYIEKMETIFDKDCANVFSIRNVGCCKVV